jgi:hypothetical protein
LSAIGRVIDQQLDGVVLVPELVGNQGQPRRKRSVDVAHDVDGEDGAGAGRFQLKDQLFLIGRDDVRFSARAHRFEVSVDGSRLF